MKAQHYIPFVWHTLVTMWRFVSGRWFIFRDRPLWYVAIVASAEPSDKSDECEDTSRFVAAAHAELSSRVRNAQRKMTAEETLKSMNMDGKQ